MRVFVMLLAFVCFTSSYAYSTINGGVYYVDGFIDSTDSADNLLQMNTGVNNGCGPTSLLFIQNYFWMESTGTPIWFTYDIFSARIAVEDIYDELPEAYNTVTDTDNLKTFVINVWNWSTAVKASGSNTIAENKSNMISRIGQNYPVILALEPNFTNNPVPGYAHIVIFYKYDSNTDRLYFFDPYYGYNGAFSSFTATEANIQAAIQGNLPYLRIAPGCKRFSGIEFFFYYNDRVKQLGHYF